MSSVNRASELGACLTTSSPVQVRACSTAMQRLHLDLLALCSVLAPCATPTGQQPARQPAEPARAAKPEAREGTHPWEPLSAVGTYFGPGHSLLRVRDAIVLHEHHGNWWLVADGHLASVRMERRGADLVFRLLSPLSPTDDDPQAAEALPREFVFQPGTPAEPGWSYRAGAWTGKQFLDPVATRVVRQGESVSLRRLDHHELHAQASIREDVALLRNPTPEQLRELVTGHQQEVAAAGGPERFVAKRLAKLLEEVEPSVPSGERTWLARQRERLAASGSARPALWPENEDARVLDLVTRRDRSQDTLEIVDGWRAKLANRDANRRRGCVAGFVFPEPSCNSSTSDLKPARATERGRVGQLCYAFFQMLAKPSGRPEQRYRDCEFQPAVDQTHPGQGGLPFYLFVDADSRIVGAQLVGYMSAELYLAPGITGDRLRTMLAAQREEIGRQAE
jgi:hypothetical protein